MLTYGDGVGDVNIAELLEFHKSHGKLATVTTVRPSRFGIIEANSIRCNKFQRETPTRWLDERRLLRARAPGLRLSRRRRLHLRTRAPGAAGARRPVDGLPHDGFFYAMDTYREYEHLNELWNAKQAPWKVWQE
jgi:glucose-1-phosphate cytidylyltransferase